MQIHDLGQNSEEQESLVWEIHDYLCFYPEGLHVVLERDDLSGDWNTLYQKPAFYMNIRRGGVEEMSPQYIVDIMGKSDCVHFIWVSRDQVHSSELDFIRVYSHEIQHLRQNIKFPGLSETFTYISEAIPRVLGHCTQLGIPTELDAEVFAWNTLVAIRGADEAEKYIATEAVCNPKAKSYYNDLKDKLAIWTGDLIAETRRVLAKSPHRFIKDLSEVQSHGRFLEVSLDIFLSG